MIQPTRTEFVARYAERIPAPGPRLLVPVWREILFDTDTAVTAYARIFEPPFGFLLESVVGGETWARYTFLGTQPRAAWRVTARGSIAHWTPEHGWGAEEAGTNPLDALTVELTNYELEAPSGFPRFLGGAVGYLGYDVVRYIERLPDPPSDDLGLPDAIVLFTETLIAIDNLFGRARIITLVEIPEQVDELEAAYDRGEARINAIITRLRERSAPAPLSLVRTDADAPFTSSYSREAFEANVERIRAYIAAGDAFQVVLSQRLCTPLESDPFDLYRALRSLNPSPYLYYLQLDDLALVGSSPEVLVRVEDGRVVVRPIAGTRPRGKSEADDDRMAQDLIDDPKERAEHLMLVDLGRNDVGRVARFGTVQVPDYFTIERYSHVLHLVSQVEGLLRPGLNAIDVLRACFPAGTVSGAPKVRAMQIIDELEPVRRGPYAGAVGYIGYGATAMDTAIAIRTLIARDGQAYIQAGAGIVADSVPAHEYEETLAKARALLRVLASVQGGTERA
ncbi:MAG: anthranilate synthase component I [Longimicrobiales bacterium]